MLYFLKSHRTGLVKIGRTSYFRSRYSDLCAEHSENLEILGVVSEERFQERELHKVFAKLRVVKEWFADDAVLRRFISEHATKEFAAHDSPRNEVLVPIDRVIAYRAKKNAARRGERLSGYIDGLLRRAVDEDFKGD